LGYVHHFSGTHSRKIPVTTIRNNGLNPFSKPDIIVTFIKNINPYQPIGQQKKTDVYSETMASIMLAIREKKGL